MVKHLTLLALEEKKWLQTSELLRSQNAHCLLVLGVVIKHNNLSAACMRSTHGLQELNRKLPQCSESKIRKKPI